MLVQPCCLGSATGQGLCLCLSFIHLCFQRLFRILYDLGIKAYKKLERTIPGFNAIMEKVEAESDSRDARIEQKREARKKAEEERALFGKVRNEP